MFNCDANKHRLQVYKSFNKSYMFFATFVVFTEKKVYCGENNYLLIFNI